MFNCMNKEISIINGNCEICKNITDFISYFNLITSVQGLMRLKTAENQIQLVTNIERLDLISLLKQLFGIKTFTNEKKNDIFSVNLKHYL